MLWRPSGKLVSFLIVALWLVMVVMFFRHEKVIAYLTGGVKAVPAALTNPTDTWMGFFLPPDDARVGFINISTTPDRRNGTAGVAMNVTARLNMVFLATPMEILILGSGWIPQDNSAGVFDLRLSSEEHSMSISGKLENGFLDAKIKTAGETIPVRIPVSKETLMAGASGVAMTLPKLKVGQEISIDAFDPVTLSVGKAKITCVREEKLTIMGKELDTKVLLMDMNGITSTAWIDADQQILRAETPFGFTMQKITQKEALAPISSQTKSNLLDLVAIRPTGQKTFRKAVKMVIELSGTPGRISPPSDETQTLTGNRLTVIKAPEPGPQSAPETGFDEFLKADALVQSDHAKIKEAVAGMVGAETDTWKRAQLIYEWVYTNIEKKSVFSIPSALEVLETRQGDCNEHATLYTALGRAAGIPTRTAIGIVWSDELKGFYYHAWPEVHVNGRWIPIDPTLGQPIADATHVKLLEGNIETWPQLIPYIGQVKINVLSCE